MSTRALLARVQRLEEARTTPRTPFELDGGSFEAWAAEVRADVSAGRLDATDMLGGDGNGGVLGAIRRWHEQGVYGVWSRNRHRVWEMGQ